MRHRVFVAGMSAIVAVGMLPPAAQAQSADGVPQSADSTLLAARKKAKGTLRVKVTGAGTYTVKGKGLRKNATATKSFRVLPGVYRVKAPGGTVKPKKTVRVRKGATTTVRVRFPKKAPAPSPTPTVPVKPPASGPVSQFVQAGAEATVGTADGYAIHIPAGVLQQSATVSVTPLDAAPGGLPGADFRIDGAWVGAVQVSLPTADATTDPVVLHEAGDGMRITSGNAVQQASPGGIPVATVSVTSLSPFYSAAIDCDGIPEVARGVLCADQADRRLSEIWTELGSAAAEAVETQRASASAVSSACPNTTPAMVSAGDLAKGIACSESMSGSWGEWGFTNTTHASYLGDLYSAGAVYTMNTTGAFERSVERPDDIPFILYPLYEPIKDWYLFPKQKTKIRKTVGSGVSTVSTDPDPGVTPLWASAGFLIGMVGGKLIDDLVADPHTNLAGKIALCVPQASVSLSSSTINCVKTAFIEALTYYAKNASLGSKARAAGALAKVLSAGDLLMIGRSFWLALEAKIGSGMNSQLSIKMNELDSGIDPPNHPKTVNSYIARDPDTGRSVLVDRGRVTVIGTGTLFNCLARTRAVWDIGNLKALKQTADGTQISCYDEGPEWTYTPTASGGNTGTNIILRNATGNAWLINSAGEIQTIPDGGTYLCLAAANPVIWNFPDDKINAWMPVGTQAADCGVQPLGGTPGAVQRVSAAADGLQAKGYSYAPAWSPDGTKVAFYSDASNLVSEDTNNRHDVFVKTLSSGAVERVSTAADGTQANNASYELVWSPDGTKIAFHSYASNLSPGDTNGAVDVFVKTLSSGAVQRVSTAADGTQANGDSDRPMWSPDGTKIAFYSIASNLVTGDTNNRHDVFVKTLSSGAVERVSTAADGTQANGFSYAPVWSPDGTKIAFYSYASNLSPGDTNGAVDVFVKTLLSGAVQRVSTAADATQANGDSDHPMWSPDGTKIAFSSTASNLVTGDTNSTRDVFVKTLSSGAVERVSTAADGSQANDSSGELAWFPDGMKVAFASTASNLSPGDTNGAADVFVKTLSSGAVQRVSSAADGTQANNHSAGPVWSPDGTRIAFNSWASNLVTGDTNNNQDVFVKTLE